MKHSISISVYLFALFALFVLFADELFFGYVSISGMGLESGMKSREAIVIAGIAYILLIKDVLNQKLSNRNYTQLIVLILLLILYYITQFFFPLENKSGNYMARLLVFGSLCIPACYVGMKLASGKYNDALLRLLPAVVIVVSAIVAFAVITTSMMGSILNDDEDVFNYQSASYYLSFCFSYSFFYVFLYKDKRIHRFSKLETIGMLITLVVCVIGCILGGGRGAFVYLVCVCAFMVYRLLKLAGKMKWSTIFLFLGAVGFILILAQRFQVFDSTGFLRVMENLTNDDARIVLWKSAIKAFQESPLFGHGLGSIWWTVGFYSHNMLTDFLAETGLVGTTIFVVIIIKILVCLNNRSKYYSFDMFIYLVFLGVMIHNTFSGYWFSAPKLFFAFGYVFGLNSQWRKPTNKNRIVE